MLSGPHCSAGGPFSVYAKDGRAEQAEKLQPTALRCFIECSITMQDNMIEDPTNLANPVKKALIRDLKMLYQLRDVLRQSFKAHPWCLASAVANVLPHAGDAISRSYSGLTYLDESWVQLSIRSNQRSKEQTIQ